MKKAKLLFRDKDPEEIEIKRWREWIDYQGKKFYNTTRVVPETAEWGPHYHKGFLCGVELLSGVVEYEEQ